MRQKIEHKLYQGFLYLRNKKTAGRYLRKLYHIFEILKPVDEYIIAICAMKLFLKVVILCSLIFFAALKLAGYDLYYFFMLLFMIYVISDQIVSSKIEREEEKLLKQFEKFIGEVRHSFHDSGTVEDAVYESLENAEYEISLHMNKIYEMLVEEENDDSIAYMNHVPNRFFLSFYALCQVTAAYGDTIHKNQSSFLSNLNHIKNEINTEILKQEKIKHVFSGLQTITFLPVFFLKTIEHWSISNLPELQKFYHGMSGILASTIIFLLTLLSYYCISRMKENYEFERKEHLVLEFISQRKYVKRYLLLWCHRYSKKAVQLNELLKKAGNGLNLKQFLIQKRLIFIITIILSQCVIWNMINCSKRNVIDGIQNFSGVTTIDSQQDTGRYRQIIFYNFQKFCVKTGNSSHNKSAELYEEIKNEIRKDNSDLNSYTIEKLTEEIRKRAEEYKKYKYQWYYLGISIFLSWIACCIPWIVLLIKKEFQTISMEDEVMQFQGIIIMLIHLPGIHVSVLLEWIENVSLIFRNSILECVDYYSYDEEKAFYMLKEKEPFPPLVRLVENLEACDKIGVEQAFWEIEGERSYYLEKRKQDNEIMITNKGVIGKAAAYIPMIATIGFYLIVPFVLESIAKLMNYMEEMNGIGL